MQNLLFHQYSGTKMKRGVPCSGFLPQGGAERLVKRRAMSTQNHIFIDSVSQMIMLLVHITNIAYFYPNLSQKGKYLKDS